MHTARNDREGFAMLEREINDRFSRFVRVESNHHAAAAHQLACAFQRGYSRGGAGDVGFVAHRGVLRSILRGWAWGWGWG